MGTLRIDEALRAARAAGVDRLDAQWLLGHLLQRPRAWLLAHDDEPLPPEVQAAWGPALARRAAGEPLAYVVGEREFCGLRLAVSPAVLVPRPETEGLVDWALALAPVLPGAPPVAVADLGTGSGAIALALKARAPAWAVTATDLSAGALAVARANATRLQLDLDFAQGPWWQAVPGRRFGLVVSNPPYIAEGDPHLPALRHEPRSALTAGPDGLADLHVLIDGAPAHLLRGGWLLLEHGHDQAEPLQQRLRRTGFVDVQTRPDLAALPRFTAGRWPD